MRTSIIRTLLAALLCGAVAAAPPTGGPRYPKTDAGRRAAAYFAAFNRGEAAMKAFLTEHAAPDALKRRSIEDRLAIYRDMREEHGSLTPIRVAEASEDGARVIARTERGGRLSVQILCESAAPHRFLGLRVEDDGDDAGAGSDGISEGARAAGETSHPAPPPGPPMSETQIVAALAAHLDSLTSADAFSGAVLLAKGDRVLLRRGYGLASRRDKVPNRPETRFNLGSINKAFTRVAIERLAAEAALRLDDTIDRYLPDYPKEAGSKITIAMLLEHRGGVPDIFGPKYDAADRTRLRSVADWMALVRDEPLLFEPGTRERYSNGGYVLLGAIIEKVTGRSYYDYVREKIYRPAGMTDTDSYEADDPVAAVAMGYTKKAGGDSKGPWRENRAMQPMRGSPAGGGYSTVDDLFRFAQSMRRGVYGGAQVNGIAGGSPGTNALLETSGDWTLVVLANMDPPVAERVGLKTRGWLRRSGSAVAQPPRTSMSDAPMSDAPESTVLPASAVRVPMRWAGHLASVEVRIDGQGPFRFAIDTGAAGCARIDAALARRLGLAEVGSVRVGDPSGRNVTSAPVVRLGTVAIEGARFEGVTATLGDYASGARGEAVDGILGFGLFAQCLVTLDFPALEMRLERGTLPEASGADVLPFRTRHGVPAVLLRVAGIDVEADLDAGAMGGISLPEAMASRLPLAAPPRVVGRARTVSNEFEIRAAQLDGDASLGSFTFPRPMVEFQPIFPMANVGARVLRDFAVTFDARNERLRLVRRD